MIHLINGNSLSIPLADETVHCIAISPPYYSLRDYGVKGQLGQEPLHDCRAWARRIRVIDKDSYHWWKRTYKYVPEPPCGNCYVCNIRTVMDEVWRVLHPTGTVWINLADNWVRDPKKGIKYEAGAGTYMNNRQAVEKNIGAPIPPGLKQKDLYGIPYRVALALQADGWYWRSKPPWIKKNAMPSSASDRPSTYHEEILFFSKTERYFYDRYSVLRPATQASLERSRRAVHDGHKNIDGAPGQVPHSLARSRANANKHSFSRRSKFEQVHPDQQYSQHRDGRENEFHGLDWRNWRTSDTFFDSLALTIEQEREYLSHLEKVMVNGGFLVDEEGMPLAFQVNPTGYQGNHYAVWPRALVHDMLKASTSRHGACPSCGNQWKREVQKGEPQARHDNPNPVLPYPAASGLKQGQGKTTLHQTVEIMTKGWTPTCDHDRPDVVPPVVLDCFVGSGTTMIEARALGLTGIGIDINLNNLLVDCHQRLDLDKLEAFEQGRGIVVRPPRKGRKKPNPGQASLF